MSTGKAFGEANLQATLQKTDEKTASEEGCSTTEPELSARYQGPHDHLGFFSSVSLDAIGVVTVLTWDPHIRTNFLAHKLRRQLRKQESDSE